MMRLIGWLWPWVIVVVLAAALVDLAEREDHTRRHRRPPQPTKPLPPYVR